MVLSVAALLFVAVMGSGLTWLATYQMTVEPADEEAGRVAPVKIPVWRRMTPLEQLLFFGGLALSMLYGFLSLLDLEVPGMSVGGMFIVIFALAKFMWRMPDGRRP